MQYFILIAFAHKLKLYNVEIKYILDLEFMHSSKNVLRLDHILAFVSGLDWVQTESEALLWLNMVMIL